MDLNDGALRNYCLFLYLSLVVEIEIELKQTKLLFTLANTFVKYQYMPLKMINWVAKNRDKKCKITVYLRKLKKFTREILSECKHELSDLPSLVSNSE